MAITKVAMAERKRLMEVRRVAHSYLAGLSVAMRSDCYRRDGALGMDLPPFDHKETAADKVTDWQYVQWCLFFQEVTP